MKGPVEILEEEMDRMTVEQTSNTEGETDFSEYIWMADEMEEFDRKVEEELWEEFFIEACFEEMFDEEEDDWILQSDGKTIAMEKLECLQAIQALQEKKELNPNAPEFVPRCCYLITDHLPEDDDYAQR